MDINDLRKLREKENMSFETIADLSGIPLDIVTKIFLGEIHVEDIKQLCAGVRVELIDGKFHTMSTPNRMHQFLSIHISTSMLNHIHKNNGKCHIYTAPLGVRLFADDETWVEPDILVVCNRKEILTEYGCNGAPDLIVEIVSPSNSFHDYVTKLMKYQQAGVHEYWIVDPRTERVSVICYEDTEKNAEYTYEDIIQSIVLEGFTIRVADFIDKFDVKKR